MPSLDEQHRVESLAAEQDLNRGAGDVHAVGDDFGGDFGIGEDRADDAGIAVREGTHGVVHMHGVARSGLNRGAGLIVVRVGVADGDDDFGRDGMFDQFQRPGISGAIGEDFHEAVGGFEKFLQGPRRTVAAIASGGCTPRRALLMNGPSR